MNKQVNMTKEELKIKLYERMAQRIGDERFGLPAQQAAGRFTALQEQMGGHVGVYASRNADRSERGRISGHNWRDEGFSLHRKR